MIKGLRTAIYPATNLTAAKEWYAKAFEREPYFDEPFYVGFNIGGFELGLIPDGQPGATGVVAYWGVDDAAEAHGRLLGLGATADVDPHDVGEGIKVGTVKDPFGNLLGIIENPHFDTGAVE